MRLAGKTLAQCQAALRRGTIESLSRALRRARIPTKKVDRRGRPRLITATKLRRLNICRLSLLSKKPGMEVTLSMVKKAARVSCDDTTVSRALKHLGVAWRKPRVKPQRTEDQIKARKCWCKKYQKPKKGFWENCVFIDCKKFDMALSKAQRIRQNRLRIRGVLRTRGEGLEPSMTKPSATKHRAALPSAHVFAAVFDGRVRVFRYIVGRWNAAEAVASYDALQSALRKRRPAASKATIVEDNDPAGFKSRAGIERKREHKMNVISLPPYTPELQPLDYSLWRAIESKVASKLETKKRKLSVKEFKQLLQRTAYSLPTSVVQAAVEAMPRRVLAILQADGKDIQID